jgi:thioredoxin reductase
MDKVEEIEIIISGGGICGLATALALHRFLLLILFFLSLIPVNIYLFMEYI